MSYEPKNSRIIEKTTCSADRILVYFKNGEIKEYRVPIEFLKPMEDIEEIYKEFLSSDCDTFYNEKIKQLPYKWIKKQRFQ